MSKNNRLFPTNLVKSLLENGRLLDIIELRTGKNNIRGNIEKKLRHITVVCDNLDGDEIINWTDYVYMIGIEPKPVSAMMGWLSYFYRARCEHIYLKNRIGISKFLGTFRKTNKNILTSRGFIVIPKSSELGILYKLYNCNFINMLKSNGYYEDKENINDQNY